MWLCGRLAAATSPNSAKALHGSRHHLIRHVVSWNNNTSVFRGWPFKDSSLFCHDGPLYKPRQRREAMRTQDSICSGLHFPNEIPFLNQSAANPPLKWEQKKKKNKPRRSHKLSCVVLYRPWTLPSHHAPPLHHGSRSGFLTLRFLPSPQPSTPPVAPLWPPVTPIHPPTPILTLPRASPQLPALCAFLPPPSSPSSASPCLCVWEASKGSEEREAAEKETGSGEGSYRSHVKLELETFLFWHALIWHVYVHVKCIQHFLSVW